MGEALEKRTRFTSYIDGEILQRAKAVSYWEREPLAALLESALEREIERLEKKNGEVYKPIPQGKQPRQGRPMVLTVLESPEPPPPAMTSKEETPSRATEDVPESKEPYWRCSKCMAHMPLKTTKCYCGEPRAA